MNVTRFFIISSVALMALAMFLTVSYSQELSPPATEEDVELFERLTDLYDTIEANHYAKADTRTLFSGAVNGLLHQMDPHSAFIDIQDYGLIEEQYRGNYQGIGVSFVLVDEKITVVDVLDGGPSDKAGVQMGDLIVEIEGESALGITTDDVQNKLRGPGGTKVKVGIERHGHDELLPITITRGHIPIQSVQNTMMLDENTGYVQMTRFARPTALELESSLDFLQKMGMKQVVLDLRGNGGGLLGTAIAVTDKFLVGERLIVYTDGQTESAHQSFYSYKNGNNWDIPLVILINHSSASASEIVAGALQDWDRAVIVGETSFGKGLVQSSYVLNDNSRLLLTTSHYFTPTGRLIQRPYKDIDLETYQMAGLDGNDSGTFEDLELPEEAKPVYFTPSGRQVFGGGGITPDVTFKSELLFDPLVYSLSNQLVFFMYGREYFQDHPIGDMAFDEYFESFTVTDDMLKNLLDKAIEREFVYYPRRGQRYSAEQLKAAFWELKDDMSLFLKSELAQFYFGRPKGYAIRALNRDKILSNALKQFGTAQELATQYKTIDPNYFAASKTEKNRGQ